MITEFRLNEIEAKRAEEFEEKHAHPNVRKGAIGGHIEYRFTPTSIGTAASMHCYICGKEENITDYNW
jgi:hypothetical protein